MSDFSSDLMDIWTAGKIKIPACAQLYVEANRQLAGTTSLQGKSESELFTRTTENEDGSGTATGPTQVYEAWKNARDDLQYVFAMMATHLEDTGDALMLAYEEYKSTDQEAADDLEKKGGDIDKYNKDAQTDENKVSEDDAESNDDPIMPESKKPHS